MAQTPGDAGGEDEFLLQRRRHRADEIDAGRDRLDGRGDFVAGLIGLHLHLARVEHDMGVGQDITVIGQQNPRTGTAAGFKRHDAANRIGNGLGLGFPSRIDLAPAQDCTVRVVKGAIESYSIAGQRYDPRDVWHERQFTAPGLAIGLFVDPHYERLTPMAVVWFALDGNLRAALVPEGVVEGERHDQGLGRERALTLGLRVRHARGLPCTAEQVVVTSGSQQAIAMSALALLGPGERAAMEMPGYRAAAAALALAVDGAIVQTQFTGDSHEPLRQLKWLGERIVST